MMTPCGPCFISDRLLRFEREILPVTRLWPSIKIPFPFIHSFKVALHSKSQGKVTETQCLISLWDFNCFCLSIYFVIVKGAP